ncbi:XRCC4-like factor-domain-containing protein [Aspergillus granulosus]|uniref:Non-homologous end-joining factor 1 n=1 Tax=Aspergillus granulosus TaxID=176169 RepID=A0ABR4H4N9_9EURO
MPAEWQRLWLSNQGNLPPLLFKYSPTASGYEFYMTDLNYIWSECLDRKAIFKRADEEDTTIDPSEDSEQFKVLLQKIGEGLDNQPGCSSVLTPKAPGNGRAFDLIVTSKLPAPLRPLEWRLQLSKEPQSATTNHLLLPLIRAEDDRAACQQSLIEELGKKDWVLAKLFDNIEVMGIDLSTIFPGTSGLRSSGRKGPTLAQAAKYIKGLAPFNEQAWFEEVRKSSSDSGLAAKIITAISGDQVSGKVDSLQLQPPPDGWWENLSIAGSNAIASTPQKSNKKTQEPKPPVGVADTGSETGDEEFERQETPPWLKKPANTDDTQSENEDIHLPKREKGRDKQTTLEHRTSSAVPPNVTPASKPKGLGKIGGKRQVQPKVLSPSPAPSPPRAKEKTPSPQGAKQLPLKPPVNDDEDETTDDEPQTSHNRPPVKTVPKPSRGLGVIGGKKKKEPEPEPEPESESISGPQAEAESESQSPEPKAQTQSEPKKKKPLGKLGVIGGAKAKAKPKPSVEPRESISPVPNLKMDDEEKAGKDGQRELPSDREMEHTPSSSTPADRKVKKETPAPAEPEREETEQERADRKREELKRQLEAKSKAPVKKKRRF